MGFQPSVDRKGIQPIRSSGLINLTFFTNLFRVGQSPTQLFLFQATWLTEEHWIKIAMKIARRYGEPEVHHNINHARVF